MARSTSKKSNLAHLRVAVAAVPDSDLDPGVFRTALLSYHAQALTPLLFAVGKKQVRRGRLGDLRILAENSGPDQAMFSIGKGDDEDGFLIAIEVHFPPKAAGDEAAIAKLAKALRQVDRSLSANEALQRAKSIDFENQRDRRGVNPVLRELTVYRFEKPVSVDFSSDDIWSVPRFRAFCHHFHFKDPRFRVWRSDFHYAVSKWGSPTIRNPERGVWLEFLSMFELGFNQEYSNDVRRPKVGDVAMSNDDTNETGRLLCNLAAAFAKESPAISLPSAYEALAELEERVLHFKIDEISSGLDCIAEACLDGSGQFHYRPASYDNYKIPGFATATLIDSGNHAMVVFEGQFTISMGMMLAYGDDGMIEKCSFAWVGQSLEELQEHTSDQAFIKRAALNPDDPAAPLSAERVFERLKSGDSECPGFLASWTFREGVLDRSKIRGTGSIAALATVTEAFARCGRDPKSGPVPRL